MLLKRSLEIFFSFFFFLGSRVAFIKYLRNKLENKIALFSYEINELRIYTSIRKESGKTERTAYNYTGIIEEDSNPPNEFQFQAAHNLLEWRQLLQSRSQEILSRFVSLLS